jgi:hypothetical protein
MSVFMGSAMRTAPPCNSATPAAAAVSFAIAILSDIVPSLDYLWWLDAAHPQLHLNHRTF